MHRLLHALLVAPLGTSPGASTHAPVQAPVPTDAIALTWSALPPCPDEPTFLAGLEELVGGTIERHPEALVGVSVRLQPQPLPERGWSAELSLRRGTHVEARRYTATSCADLVDAAVVTVAAHVLAHRGAHEPPHPPRDVTSEESTTLVPAPEAGIPAPPQDVRTSRREVPTPPRHVPTSRHDAPASPRHVPGVERERADVDERLVFRPAPAAPLPPQRGRNTVALSEVALAVQGGLVAGLGPGVSGLAEVATSVGRRFLRAELAVWHRFATNAEPRRGVVARASLSGGTLMGCGVPRVRNIMFPLCIGVAVGVALARGNGNVESSAMTARTWVGLPLRVGVVWSFSPRVALRFTLWGSLGRRAGFFVQSSEGELTIFQVPRFGGGALTGLEFRLR